MDHMGLYADATALLSGWAAPWTVRYGDRLRFAGEDLDEPEVWRVPTRHGAVRCEVYRPPAGRHCRAGRVPVLVHFHGGAFIMRHPRMDDFWARYVVARTGVVVVNVDYAVAPRVRYPVAHEQAHDVVRWVIDHGGEFGLDGSRVAVGGFSAGGNLAASACLQIRDHGDDPARLLLLAVPSLDVSTTDKPAATDRPMIDARLMRLVRATYFKDASRREEPYASPLLADDLHGLPPTLVLTAELDALRAEGEAFVERLRAAGATVDHHRVPRRDHYFLDPEDPRGAEALMARMADAVRASVMAG